MFQVLDNDANGYMDKKEVRESFEVIFDLHLTDAEFEKEYFEMDKNSDGLISFKEFRKYYRHAKKKKKMMTGCKKNEAGSNWALK